MIETNPRHPIRLVAIDLDGTLLNDAKEVSDQTIAALQRLESQNIKVIIASARPPRAVRSVYEKLNLTSWQINYNGALIWDHPTQRVIHHTPMTGPLVHQIINTARQISPDVLVSCEVLDRWYTDRDDHTYTTETGKLFPPDVICPIPELCNRDITKLMLLGSPDTLSTIRQSLTTTFSPQIQIVSSGESTLLQIMHKSSGKEVALAYVASHYNIPPSQILAIGDAPNDLGMLQYAGTSVAMHNAHPSIKSIATWLAPSNNHHGVHAALSHFHLLP